jgi:hypothetical protein
MKALRHFVSLALLPAAALNSSALPIITGQPTNQSVSLGANVRFLVSATTTNPPLRYQWQFAATDLAAQTNASLDLTNVQLIHAGDYDAVVTDGLGSSLTSLVAHLEIDPTFTKVTTGPIVAAGGYSFACAWGDYDNDGFIDLFVCNSPDGSGVQHDFLYRNKGDGTFERVTSGPLVNAGRWGLSAAWGDYDNDGNLDLFVSRPQMGGAHAPNTLYHNEGDGTFTQVTTGLLVTQPMYSHAGVWADFNNDGLLDLFVANFNPGGGAAAMDNYLYQNRGDGSFDRISFGTKSPTNGNSFNAAAADFNNDGWMDLFVPQGGGVTAEKALLYRNNRDGTFFLLTNTVVSAKAANSIACTWGDYDNDGFLDLFVSNFYEQNNFLYHNNGDGTFSVVPNTIVTLDAGASEGCAWADYDNDGWLDLFVANAGKIDPNTGNSMGPENNFLYHNNGDGTFTKIRSGSLVNDLGYCTGCAWGDYNNDGFPDLFVANGRFTGLGVNFLYRNNGNSNNWVKFNLVGTVSNRSAIGAKVRVRATIFGRTFWQMREISGGSNYGSQNDTRPNFGLGNATNADLVRIEWPSGIVQTMTNVAAKQFLTVVEHQEPGATNRPNFTSLSRSINGAADLSVSGDKALRYLFETSTNLLNWTWLAARTNLTGSIQFTDTNAASHATRFYRVSIP